MSLRTKFDNIEKGKKEIESSMNDYKQSLREFNMYKHIESSENISRL